jgi:predicted Na+-dependent transporter
VLPHDWPLTHSRTMYFCALVLYALVGLALGLLLGRLTGRTKSESQSGETG